MVVRDGVAAHVPVSSCQDALAEVAAPQQWDMDADVPGLAESQEWIHHPQPTPL